MDDANFVLGQRSDLWYKMKKDYVEGEGLHDSLDVVPIAGVDVVS